MQCKWCHLTCDGLMQYTPCSTVYSVLAAVSLVYILSIETWIKEERVIRRWPVIDSVAV